MSMLGERHERGRAIKALMASGNPSHFILPGIDQLAPDLKRFINERLSILPLGVNLGPVKMQYM
jgi:hypothetical protein